MLHYQYHKQNWSHIRILFSFFHLLSAFTVLLCFHNQYPSPESDISAKFQGCGIFPVVAGKCSTLLQEKMRIKDDEIKGIAREKIMTTQHNILIKQVLVVSVPHGRTTGHRWLLHKFISSINL